MKWILTYVFPFAFSFLVTFLAKSQNEFNDGINAYNQKDYALAVSKFENILSTQPNNTSAWYNLGLSNIGLKSYGQAIWNFEKVLKYDPNDNQAEEKIEYSYNQLYPDLEWQPRLNSFESSLYSLSPTTWSIISISLSIICSVLLTVYFTRKQSSLRKAILAINIFFICCFIGAIVISSSASNYYSNDNFAVITNKSIPTFIGNSASPQTKITEGTRVEIINQKEGDLVEIKTETGELHVVSAKELNII